jgi:hypothetical protein
MSISSDSNGRHNQLAGALKMIPNEIIGNEPNGAAVFVTSEESNL